MVNEDSLFNEARAHHQAGRIGQAVAGYRNLLKRMPKHPHAHYLLGVAFLQLEHYEDAIRHLKIMINIRPAHVPTRLSLAQAYASIEETDNSRLCFDKVLEIDPGNVDALCGLAEFLQKREEHESVIELLRVHWDRNPDSLAILGYLTRAYNGLHKQEESALLCLDFMDSRTVSRADKDSSFNWLNSFFPKITHPGNELIRKLSKQSTARGKKLYLLALIRNKQDMAFAKAYSGFRQLDPDGEIFPDTAIIHQLHISKLYEQAVTIGWELLQNNPDDEENLRMLVENLLGMAKSDHPEKYVEAKEIAQQFLDLHPDSIKANLAMGSVFMGASRPELALPYQEKVLAVNPNHPVRGSMLFTMNYDENRSPESIYSLHQKWGEWFEKDKKPLTVDFPNLKTDERRLKIGYISPDLGRHPVGYFFIDILKGHNPDNVEVFLYSNRNEIDGDDDLSREFREHVGDKHWMWTRDIPAQEVVKRIRSQEIDILIEMAGHTGHNRMDVCAHRAAPIQVEWLGYPNTTGLTTIDYRFSDAVTEPEGDADERSSEKIWRLPNGFHSIRMPRDLPPVQPPPCLKNGYITFGTYNNMNKLGSESIRLWADLLKRVPKSRIIIKHKTLNVLNNRESLLSQFAMHGIQSWRVKLRETTPGISNHMASYGDIDIALDPIAYNGTTTSCDALMMGVPILTIPGRTHAARVTASLLHRMGMDGWIAEDRKHFLQIGSMAAQNFQLLNELRSRQRQLFMDSPLNDGLGMARDLEEAYRKMWAVYCQQDESENEIIL